MKKCQTYDIFMNNGGLCINQMLMAKIIEKNTDKLINYTYYIKSSYKCLVHVYCQPIKGKSLIVKDTNTKKDEN